MTPGKGPVVWRADCSARNTPAASVRGGILKPSYIWRTDKMTRYIFPTALLAAGLVANPAFSATVGALDGVSDSSTFGSVEINQVDPFGWATEAGSATDARGLSLSAAHNPFLTPVDNHTGFVAVFDTGVAVLANTTYQLDFLVGHYSSGGTGGTYTAQVGTLDGGVFTELGSASGDLTGQNFALFTGTGLADQASAASGAAPGTGNVAVRLTSSGENFLGFDNIVLNDVPEPGSLALMGLGGMALLRRRR